MRAGTPGGPASARYLPPIKIERRFCVSGEGTPERRGALPVTEDYTMIVLSVVWEFVIRNGNIK